MTSPRGLVIFLCRPRTVLVTSMAWRMSTWHLSAQSQSNSWREASQHRNRAHSKNRGLDSTTLTLQARRDRLYCIHEAFDRSDLHCYGRGQFAGRGFAPPVRPGGLSDEVLPVCGSGRTTLQPFPSVLCDALPGTRWNAGLISYNDIERIKTQSSKDSPVPVKPHIRLIYFDKEVP